MISSEIRIQRLTFQRSAWAIAINPHHGFTGIVKTILAKGIAL